MYVAASLLRSGWQACPVQVEGKGRLGWNPEFDYRWRGDAGYPHTKAACAVVCSGGPDVGTLYLDHRKLELREAGGALVIHDDTSQGTTIPLGLIDRLVMRGHVRLDSSLLGALARHNIGVLVLGGRRNLPLAVLAGVPRGDARLRLAQYRWSGEAGFRVAWAHALVMHKLVQQAGLLQRAVLRRPYQRYRLQAALRVFRELQERLADHDGFGFTLSGLRAIEGAAASAYFQALGALLPAALGFTGRNRRPPRDPVNACLSLGYTLLHQEAVTAVYATGLDPFIGFFHEPAPGRESLASDLVDPLRPRVDEWLIGLFCTRRIEERHFRHEGDTCLLDRDGRACFYEEYEHFVPPWRRWLRRVVRRLAQRLTEPTRPGRASARFSPPP